MSKQSKQANAIFDGASNINFWFGDRKENGPSLSLLAISSAEIADILHDIENLNDTNVGRPLLLLASIKFATNSLMSNVNNAHLIKPFVKDINDTYKYVCTTANVDVEPIDDVIKNTIVAKNLNVHDVIALITVETVEAEELLDSAETVNDAPVPAETTGDAPAETTGDAPAETVNDVPVPAETTGDALAETVNDVPVPAETTGDAPVETVNDVPVPAETVNDAPVETTGDVDDNSVVNVINIEWHKGKKTAGSNWLAEVLSIPVATAKTTATAALTLTQVDTLANFASYELE